MLARTSRSAVSAVVIAGLLLIAAAAFAAPRTRGSGTFTNGPLVVTSQRLAGKNVIITEQGPITLAGTVTGAGVITERDVIHKSGTATFHGTWTCTCTVNGVTGAIVTRFEGKAKADGSFAGRFKSSGQGALASLHGHGIFSGSGDAGVYTLR